VRTLGIEIRRLIAHPRAPVIALALILVYSAAARVLYLGDPCSTPCTGGSAHGLIFDEAYYVNAARVIDGIHPPAGAPYARAPLHKDPNAEHPQLAKLIIAGTIKLFGDDPWGWRFGSVLFGLIAILTMYGLVRSARGSPWLAVGAAGVMALDNLMLIHGRIGTLDIYYLAMVLIAAVLYLRDHPLLSGLALGIGGCMKLVALAAIPAFVLLELFVVLWARGGSPGPWTTLRTRAVPLVVMAGASVITLLIGVWVMDLLVPGYDPGTHIA
jgi:dolichyl-phosphate-mannose--protein O-mannosyl transferase